LTIILFTVYVGLAIGEVFWCVHNIRTWKKCFRLVQFLPLDNMKSLVGDPNDMNDAFSTKSITDLHLIMALVEVNEASRNTIYLAMKTLSVLSGAEIDKFLPVFSEVILWGATEEEGVDDLVKKMVKTAEQSK